jgi:Spy/CpxP family protein refolding chaperone
MASMGGMSGGGAMRMMDGEKMMSGTGAMSGGAMSPGMGMMAMDDMMKGGMSGGGGGSMTGMGMMDRDMIQMQGMMGMGPGAGTGMASALPGFPGASHLYHMGATGFFLDHGPHIQLTVQQQQVLNGIKAKSLMDKAATRREIEAAEQELWTLTASDQPDATKIEAKVRVIEKLRGEQRLDFIRAVGEAAQVLTVEQRKSLLGELPPQTSQPAPAGGMGRM